MREGRQTALEYLTGYLIELSLSVDNLFVFLLIFQYFAVPAGAAAAGAQVGNLRRRAHARLHDGGWRAAAPAVRPGSSTSSASSSSSRGCESSSRVGTGSNRRRTRWCGWHGDSFRLLRATPRQHFFHHLRLRAWPHTALPGAPGGGVERPGLRHRQHPGHLRHHARSVHRLQLELCSPSSGSGPCSSSWPARWSKFPYLKPAVALILVFVGAKMVGGYWVHLPTEISLAVILGVLSVAIVASLLKRPKTVGEET